MRLLSGFHVLEFILEKHQYTRQLPLMLGEDIFGEIQAWLPINDTRIEILIQIMTFPVREYLH